MSKLDPAPTARVEEMPVSRIEFLGEQDGPSERKLKSHLTALFQHQGGIHRAYLARVFHAASNSVCLCLYADAPDPGTVGKIGQIFAAMFGAPQHLDILFLDDDQETELARFCKPFWSMP
ncbi:MAG TPA: enhanced serine sensitivity protein SseB C-terminal domain-containing protein [Hyphomicrobiaceae bacterium]|jgi:SseB protein C-terminal domain|nr:enhanced serine sensitivity protein SseB C-terminal domain-containing protein [Hyphomicrobiaceae bacterium]